MENTIKETTRLLLQGTLTKDEADKILLDLIVVRQQSELLFAFCTYLEETTNIKPFIYKDRIVNRFIEGK